MSESKRFDLLGWFSSACLTILVGAAALTIAVHLIAAIWVWLVLGAGVVGVVAFATALLVAWHRRQSW
jgi:hypothetical protein